MVDEDKESSNDVRVLKLNETEKYREILTQTLESYKEDETRKKEKEEVEDPHKPIIYEPWTLRKLRIFGSAWFAMLLFITIGNLMVYSYYRLMPKDGISRDEAESQITKVFRIYSDEFQPFNSFLDLSSNVTDRDYSSFYHAVKDLNTYFPLEQFERSDFFVEEGFHFNKDGIYYLDPE